MDEQESKATPSSPVLNRDVVPEAHQPPVPLDLDPRDASLVRWLAGSESSSWSEADAGTEAGTRTRAGAGSDATPVGRLLRHCTLLDRDDALWTGDPPPLALRMGMPLHAVILANVAVDFERRPSSSLVPTADEVARFERLQIAYRHALMEVGGGTEGGLLEKEATTNKTKTTITETSDTACQSRPVPPLLRLSPRMILEHDSRRMELKRRCEEHLDVLAREAERDLLDGVEDESRRAEGRARRTKEARRRRRQREKTKRRTAAAVEASEEEETVRRAPPANDVALAKNGDGDGGSTGTREEKEKVELGLKRDEDQNSATSNNSQGDTIRSEPAPCNSHEGEGVETSPIKSSQTKVASGRHGGSEEPENDNGEEAAAVGDENTSPNERDDVEDDEANSSSSSKTPPTSEPNVTSYLDAVKSSHGQNSSSLPGSVPPNSSRNPMPSLLLTPSASAPSSSDSSSSATTSSPEDDDEGEAAAVGRLERRLESQRREHVEMIQQVQLRAFIAETKATAAVDRTRELERRLLDATYPEVAAAAAEAEAAEGGGSSSPVGTRRTGALSRSTAVEHLELRLRSQRRDHLAMMRRVQLRTYLAETKARAAEERSRQLEELLAREGCGDDRDDA